MTIYPFPPLVQVVAYDSLDGTPHAVPPASPLDASALSFTLGLSPAPSLQDEWRQRLVSAYGSSARVFGGGGDGGSGGSFESNSHTRKRRTRSTSTPTPGAAAPAGAATTTTTSSNSNNNRQDNGGAGAAGGGGGDEAVAVEELCSALGVPCVQDVAASGPAMSMVRAWGRQFAGAFGPAQPGAGICGIGSEVRRMENIFFNTIGVFFVGALIRK